MQTSTVQDLEVAEVQYLRTISTDTDTGTGTGRKAERQGRMGCARLISFGLQRAVDGGHVGSHVGEMVEEGDGQRRRRRRRGGWEKGEGRRWSAGGVLLDEVCGLW